MWVLVLPAVVLAVSTLPGRRPTLEDLLASAPGVMLALLPGQRPALEDMLRLVPALMPTVVTPELGPAIWTLAVEPAVP